MNPKLLAAYLMMGAVADGGAVFGFDHARRKRSPRGRNGQSPHDARAIAEAKAKRERKAAKRKGVANG